VVALLMPGCTSSTHRPALYPGGKGPLATRVALPPLPDKRTPAALEHIAQAFNDDYQNGVYSPVYARWDRASQAVISEADYVRRHTECASSAGARALVETVTPGPRGFWLVRYEIGGQQFVDYWSYRARHWRFDLLRSNPSSVKEYRMPFPRYARAVGCRP
jgi:hypothetical protein